ncbi:hypothetical protein [Acidihalobacter prosperus]|uniref:Uncharacterized protein n=1 Tax=Acidihalobacter prosperus TaxID=160660 RepID=A0A1A6C7N4_9GAMM|nr:hypothetical protein [Acidihalobacter prosperus]OBS10560.1 hypothetical protein Thpro_020276 [Acidihalobacter prosperus]
MILPALQAIALREAGPGCPDSRHAARDGFTFAVVRSRGSD